MNSIILTAMIMLLVLFVIILAAFVVTVVAQCFIFKKAGERPWKILIPFYGQYVQLRFTWTVKMFIPYVVLTAGYWLLSVLQNYGVFNFNDIVSVIATVVTIIFALACIVFHFAMNVKLSWSFGHGIPWAIGLTLLSFIFFPITAWGKSKYIGPDIKKFNKFGF